MKVQYLTKDEILLEYFILTDINKIFTHDYLFFITDRLMFGFYFIHDPMYFFLNRSSLLLWGD